MNNIRYQQKLAIKSSLRQMPVEASDAAKYFADRILENADRSLDQQGLSYLLVESMIRALSDANYSEENMRNAVCDLGHQHGQQIADVALLMVSYMASKKSLKWKPAAIAAGIGAAAFAILGA